MKHEIDATGKKLGRIATEAAHILLGKGSVDFEKHIAADVKVDVTNASKMDVGEKKMEQKEYTRYSGYPGGLKIETAGDIVAKKGHSELIRKAVYGMLPSNRLRKTRLKNLNITE
ncbi:MAG: 50S ribosomal protein L13 [Candidatus Pacebacteria bacterium]|jgi:large subunit ribosomal protein L13|nr:50S ribosomal protein L13 [bacterium]MDP6527760.1 50S ribosomal protein L13 [Candidatus Paceibacterota bacterium]MDP6659597.1 50S ribosomal protein L13 [Candidatus Paceibacterota bacterium]|tara:strand:- start:30617 stop:30961 length:345 start_codon:yes stop_codon:yes gene_type:complete